MLLNIIPLLIPNSLLIAQETLDPNYVNGKIWVNDNIESSTIIPEQKDIMLEKVIRLDGSIYYRLSSEIGDTRLFTIVPPNVLNSACGELTSTPCGESFDSTGNDCGYICSDNCSPFLSSIYWELPIITYTNEIFLNTSCYEKLGTLHWYSFYSLDFLHDILGATNFGIISSDDLRVLYARYNRISTDPNGTSAGNDGFGIFTSKKTAIRADAISHEWGHYINYHFLNEGDFGSGIEGRAIDEGLSDVWSSILRFWANTEGNIQVFQEGTPPFFMYTVPYRRFNKTHKIYQSCNIYLEDSNLPTGVELYSWRGTDQEGHLRGVVASRWFFLLSEGTNGKKHYVQFDAPIDLGINFPLDCPTAETIPQTRFFQIDGIKHWQATQIMVEALKWFSENNNGEDISFHSYREATIQAILNLYPNDYCNVLRQNTESWYSVNVGDKMTADITAPDLVCGGFDIEIEVNHVIADAIRLKDSDGNVVPATIATNSDGTLELSYTQPTQPSDDDYHFTLESDVSEIDGITLPNNGCTLEQDIYVNVKRVVIESTPPNESLTCVGNTVTLTADAHPSVNITNYKWTKNGVFESEGLMNNTVSVDEGVGMYDYVVEVSFLSNTGTVLTETASYTVEVISPPNLTPNVPSNDLIELSFCDFDSESGINTIDALDYIENALMYQLLYEDESEVTGMVYEVPPNPLDDDEVIFRIPQAGTYYIRGTSGNCLPVQVEINVEDTPIAPPTITASQQECNPGEPVTLQANGVGLDPNSFEWYENNGTESIDNDSVLEGITEPAIYTFKAFDMQGCPTEATYEVGVVDLGIEGNEIITGDVTWNIHPGQDETITIDGAIQVLSGATLTIANGANVEFVNYIAGEIVVEEGGRLIGNNVSFRTSDCVNYDAWKGMQVLGNPNSEHTTGNQGIIDLTGGSIEEALIGILVGEPKPTGLGYVGGGQILLDNVTLENNNRGIVMGGTAQTTDNLSEVKNCRFTNSAAFSSTPFNFNNPPPYRHIELWDLATPFTVIGNTFETIPSSGLVNKEKGMGIYAYNSAYRIGGDCEADANTFDKVYEGVYDVYGEAALTHQISNNVFSGVNKGVTLNNTFFAEVSFNRFEQIPTGTAPNNISHGILTESAAMSAILANTFKTTIGGSSDFKRGLVIKNSEYSLNPLEGQEGFDFYVEDNDFQGTFGAPTQFEQDNTDLGLNINCNDYTLINGSLDWYLHSDCVLPIIGICLQEELAIAYRGSWHTGGMDNILDDSGTLTAINWRNDEPTVSSNLSIPNECEGPDEPCIPLQTPCGGLKSPPLPPSTPVEPEDDRRYFVKQVQYKLATNDYSGVVTLLEQRQEVWSDKILVATYIQLGNNSQALQTLNRIPTNRSDDVAFVNMMTAVAQEQVSANESMIRYYAADISLNPRINILAESLLSAYFNEEYIRNAASIVNGSSKTAPVNFHKFWLQLLPNPAKDRITIQWIETPVEENVQLIIYDAMGRQVSQSTIRVSKRNEVIEIGFLQSGIYYFQVKGMNNIYSFDKLVIVQ